MNTFCLNEKQPICNGEYSLFCFDFDGTITSKNALHQLCIFKFHYHSFLWRYVWLVGFICQLPLFYLLYKTNNDAFNRFLFSRYKGMKLEKLSDILNNHLLPYLSKNIFPQADGIIRQARRDQNDVIIVSASWNLIAEKVGHYLGIETCLSTTLEQRDGYLTGKVLDLVNGKRKAAIIHEYITHNSKAYSSISCYGNSHCDIDMLSIANHAYTVNPDRPLKKWAKKNQATMLNWCVTSLHWTVKLFYVFIRPLMRSCKDIEYIPKTGGCIVVANHTSYIDHLVLYTLIGIFVKRRAKFISKKEHFNWPLVSKIITYLGAYPINRETGGRSALTRTIDLLHQNEIIVIYPEGTRSRDGNIKSFKKGVVLLQEKTGCPIMPIGINGAFDIWPAHKALPRWGHIDVKCSEAIFDYEGDTRDFSVPEVQSHKVQILQETVTNLL